MTNMASGWAAFVVAALCWLAAIPVIASTREGDALLGRYWNPHRTRQVEVTREGERYVGRVVWQDEAAPGTTRLGQEILRGFRYAGEGKWTEGEVIAPDGGQVFRGRLWLEEGDLMMRGFVGVSLFGRTARMERVR